MEIKILNNLKNPDEENENQEYGWPDSFLQSILGSMLADSYFLLQSINLIKPSYFRHEAHRLIARILLKYYETYNDSPSKAILESEIGEQVKEPGLRALYLGELDACCDEFVPGAEKREYFLDKITEFAKTQALRTAYASTVDLFHSRKKDKWAQIREILQTALLVDRNVDLGLDYLDADSIEQRYKRMMEKKERQDYFTCDIPSFDEALGGGLSRGELGSIMAMSGAGKSLYLVKVAKANLQRGRNVLYITLEISEDKLSERFDAMLTTVPIRSLYYGNSPKLVKEALEEGASHWGKVVIKQFPAGTADVVTFRAFINQLHLRGFRPDLVIVDYVGECRIPVSLNVKSYEYLQNLVRDLRGMAVELDVCIWTAMQINRQGRSVLQEHEYLDDDLLASSAGMNRPLDILISLSQTEVEQKAGVGTLFLSKNRSGKSRFQVKFSRDPQTLEIQEVSIQKWKLECSKVKDMVVEDVLLDDYAKETNKFFPNRG